MDAQGLALLKRKLEALSYAEPFVPESAALTQHLVNDVIQVTESYRGLKIKAQRKSQETEEMQSKVGWPAHILTATFWIWKQTLALVCVKSWQWALVPHIMNGLTVPCSQMILDATPVKTVLPTYDSADPSRCMRQA